MPGTAQVPCRAIGRIMTAVEILVILGAAAVLGAGWIRWQFLEVRRDKALESLARRFLMDFRFGLPQDLRDAFPQFRAIHDAMERGGEFQAGINSITGRRRGRFVAFFDYQYVTVTYSRRGRWPWNEEREHRWTHTASAVAARLDFASPPLLIRPERWTDKVAALMGYEDVDFSALPEFSRRFYVNGPDRVFARRLVTPLLAAFLVDHVRCAVDFCGPWILLSTGDRLSARRAGRLIEQASQLADLTAHEFSKGGAGGGEDPGGASR